MTQPRFKHDCDHCISLGHYRDHDLYICGDEYPSVIGRFGDSPEEYQSGIGIWIREEQEVLYEAVKRARKKGIL